MTRWRAFRTRVASADPRLVRATTALALLLFGGALLLFARFLLLPTTLVVLLLAAREWAHLAPREEERRAKGLLVSLLLVLLAYPVLGVACLLLLLLFLPVCLLLSRDGGQHNLVGLFCLATLGVGFVSLYDRFGVAGLGWLIVVVVAFDTAALFGGKVLRGPKLWARVSPDKRWAGLLCGLVAAGLIGALWLLAFSPEGQIQGQSLGRSHGHGHGHGQGVFAVVASLLVGAGAQLGDLAESQLKRLVGVKDSGSLLPGHGGVLDRIDSMLCAVPVAWIALALQDSL